MKLGLGVAFSLFSFVSFARAELYISFYSGPSTSLRQDLKYREYDQFGRIVGKSTVSSDTYFRFKAGSKLTYFFSEKFGLETEYFFGTMLAGIDTTQDGRIDTLLNQNRHVFFLSFVYRDLLKHKVKSSSFYGGMGAGGVYSDFENIASDWDYGGQFFAGYNFPISDKTTFFIETKYFWAPDVTDHSTSPGKHYKTSGHNSWNPANRLFGPHYDTQVISFLFGTRFKL